MGVDCGYGKKRKHQRDGRRTAPKSEDPYLKLLTKLYGFLARRTDSKFNQIVLRRLFMSRINRAPVSIARLGRHMRGKEGKIAVVVGKVTDDHRIEAAPKVTLCALKVTETARKRLLAAGSEIITFDQLALRAPKGSNCVLLQGPRTHREAVRHFGAPGTPHSSAKPFVRAKGRKFEKARGRRKSRGFKV
eukprot:Clim_evm12s39 gene=Clim_evmTU12s39